MRELGYSEGAAWRRIKAMRLCSETAGTRERLQDGSLSLSAAAQLQNTFDLLQRTATAAADPGSAPAAAELLPGGTGTAPEAGASGAEAAAPARPVPALDAAQRQELVEQASGKSTREVKQLLAGVAPELARPADRMRALGDGRWELKVVIDSACQRGIEQLRALLSHVDPHLTLGQLVERLVQDGLQCYDPGRPPRGRRGGRPRGPGAGAEGAARAGGRSDFAGGAGRARATRRAAAGGHERRWQHPGAGSVARRGTCARDWRRRHLGGGSAARAVGRETCGGITPVSAKPAAAAPDTAPSAAKSVADRGSHATVPTLRPTPPADQSRPTALAAEDRGRSAPSPAKRLGRRSGQG